MSSPKLCCPHCGNQQLYSEEESTVLYPVYIRSAADGSADLIYGPSDFGEAQYMDEGTVFKDVIWCRGGCGSELKFAELLTPRRFAHISSPICRIEESSDRGSDVRWQAVCWAAEASYDCSWASPWQHADEFVEAALRMNGDGVINSADPAQLAYEAAEQLGRDHMHEEGVHDA